LDKEKMATLLEKKKEEPKLSPDAAAVSNKDVRELKHCTLVGTIIYVSIVLLAAPVLALTWSSFEYDAFNRLSLNSILVGAWIGVSNSAVFAAFWISLIAIGLGLGSFFAFLSVYHRILGGLHSKKTFWTLAILTLVFEVLTMGMAWTSAIIYWTQWFDTDPDSSVTDVNDLYFAVQCWLTTAAALCATIALATTSFLFFTSFIKAVKSTHQLVPKKLHNK
jgi:hypothetical protein